MLFLDDKYFDEGKVMKEDILSIFAKHIQVPQMHESRKDHSMADIKDLNQAIGALQSLDLALKKSQASLSNPDEVMQIVSNSFFMEESLFEREICIAAIAQSVFVKSLDQVLKQEGIEATSNYIATKREEIQTLLERILEVLEQNPTSQASSHTASRDFSSHYSHF